MKINLGLNNNPFNYAQVVDFFEKGYDLVSAKEHMGEYNGSPEPTAVIEISARLTDSVVEEWCKYFTQECIAVERDVLVQGQVTKQGTLVYNPDYTGDRYTFDPAYFIK